MARIENGTLPLDQLRPHPKNYNRHSKAQIARLADQIRLNGFTAPFVVNPDGLVLAGHRRRLALEKLRADRYPEPEGVERGWNVPVRFFHGTEVDELAVLAGDNPDPGAIDYDSQALAGILAELESKDALAAAGYTAERVDALIEELVNGPAPKKGGKGAPKAGKGAPNAGPAGDGVPAVAVVLLGDPDEIPEDGAARVQLGDLWELESAHGEPHRLLCGDCTDRENVRRLYGDTQVEIVLTDPPYCSGGMQERERTRGSTTACRGENIARDNLTTAGLEALIENAIGRTPASGCCFVFTDWRQLFAVRRVVEPLGYQYRALLVWDKESPGMGGPWRHQHELIYFGTRRKEPSWGNVGDVLRCKRSGNAHHTTEKPLELFETLLRNTEGATVADPFAGSGTTILAGEKTGKRAFASELLPTNADVILARYEKATGTAARLVERL